MTLVLADVATLQLMFDSMPAIPYETFMDIYCFACFIFLVVETIYSCFAGYGGNAVVDSKPDRNVMIGFCLAFCLIHIGMLIYVKRRRVIERTKLWMTSRQIKEFYKLDPSETETVMPHCECIWDSTVSLSDVRNEIFAKDFPAQAAEDKDDQERVEAAAEEMSRMKSSSSAGI